MALRLLAVLPKNYRHIALHALSVATQPVVLMDGRAVTDFSEHGPLTQAGIRECINFEVRDGESPILGFHDHPSEMWVAAQYETVAKHCAEQGWLKLQ